MTATTSTTGKGAVTQVAATELIQLQSSQAARDCLDQLAFCIRCLRQALVDMESVSSLSSASAYAAGPSSLEFFQDRATVVTRCVKRLEALIKSSQGAFNLVDFYGDEVHQSGIEQSLRQLMLSSQLSSTILLPTTTSLQTPTHKLERQTVEALLREFDQSERSIDTRSNLTSNGEIIKVVLVNVIEAHIHVQYSRVVAVHIIPPLLQQVQGPFSTLSQLLTVQATRILTQWRENELHTVQGEEELRRLLMWLLSYRNIHRTPCVKCGHIVRIDGQRGSVLPLLRVWNREEGQSGYLAYHELCM